MTIKNIVVPTDFGDLSQAALAYARRLAPLFGATLHIVHVVDELTARYLDLPDYSQLGQLQTTLERSSRSRMEALVALDAPSAGTTGTVLTSRSAAETIASFARDVHADLIVMGTHGRGAVGRFFLGSVAERVLRIAPCPVLTTRGADGQDHPSTAEIAAHAPGRNL
jgi:nucleotide-binding universal stress UspA family protein